MKPCNLCTQTIAIRIIDSYKTLYLIHRFFFKVLGPTCGKKLPSFDPFVQIPGYLNYITRPKRYFYFFASTIFYFFLDLVWGLDHANYRANLRIISALTVSRDTWVSSDRCVQNAPKRPPTPFPSCCLYFDQPCGILYLKVRAENRDTVVLFLIQLLRRAALFHFMIGGLMIFLIDFSIKRSYHRTFTFPPFSFASIHFPFFC